MNRGRTEIILLIDRSGSMDVLSKAVTAGVETFLAEQSTPQGELRLTLALFDDVVAVKYENKNQYEVPTFIHQVRGGTALARAVGEMGSRTLARINNTKEDEKPEHVIFVLMTDGEEGDGDFQRLQNAQAAYKEMKRLGWTVMYLGCGTGYSRATWKATAQQIGFTNDEIVEWTPNKRGVAAAFFEISKKTAMLRSADE